MREEVGDIWEYPSWYKVIPINLSLRNDGKAIMGAGLAKDARDRYPALETIVGDIIKKQFKSSIRGIDLVVVDKDFVILTFPTKYFWGEKSDFELIVVSALSLAQRAKLDTSKIIAMPRVGCGLGGLDWDNVVGPVLHAILPDNVVALELPRTR